MKIIIPLNKVLKINRKYAINYSRCVLLLGLLTIASVWLFVSYQITSENERVIQENFRETMNLTKAFEEHVRGIVADADKDLLSIKAAYERAGASSPSFATIVNHSMEPGRTLVAILDDQGTVTNAYILNDIAGMDRSYENYYRFHRDNNTNELYIGIPLVGKINGVAIIPLTRRINKPDGTFGGIVYIGIRADYFLSYYNNIDLGDNQLVALSGKDGFNRVRQTNNNVETGKSIMANRFWKRYQAGELTGSHVAKNEIDGSTRITSYRVMPDYPLIVSVGRSKQVALANFERFKQGYILGGVLISLFIVLLCGLLVSRHMKQLGMNAELLRLDRLNLIGEMAAGIGHEIRNPLTTVRGYLQWYSNKDEYAELQAPFTTMIDELDRANSIITEFLSLSKNKAIVLTTGNINSVLHALFPMLQAKAFESNHNLLIEKGELPDIPLDENELRQLILNLVRNGFDAMQPGGTLTIKTYVEEDTVVLAVCDTGQGIPPLILNKLGTPFVTTKENGTGLGLAVCYQIAARHDAKIVVETAGSGTIFYVKFKLPAEKNILLPTA